MSKKLLLLIICTIIGAQVTKAQEAYAVFNDGTLTFYYDNLASSRTGTVYKDDPSASVYPEWAWVSTEITKVVFDASFKNYRPTRTDGWFYYMTNLESIEHLDHLDTSNSTDMKYMFAGCEKLEEIDISHFDTRKVTDMQYMFYLCRKVKNLQFGELFKTDNVTSMWEMFTSCQTLTTLDVSGFNTQNVKDMNMMFRFCSGLTSLDLSSFDTRNVEQMEAMFYSCTGLQTIYAGPGWNTDNLEAGGTAMFYNCQNLKGGAGTTYESENIDASYAHIDVGANNPGYFTLPSGLNLVYTSFKESTNTLTYCYGDMTTATGDCLELYAPQNTRFLGYGNNVQKVVMDPTMLDAPLTTTKRMFYGRNEGELFSLKTIEDLKNLNTANVTDMSEMFYDCSSLESLDISTFDVSKVTDMTYMFQGCWALKTIYCDDDWSDTEATSSWMFSGCIALEGSKGTKYLDAMVFDASYARPDGGTAKPGYFTSKNASGITTIDASNQAERTVYDLSGRKLGSTPTQRGIYIVDGKKVINAR